MTTKQAPGYTPEELDQIEAMTDQQVEYALDAVEDMLATNPDDTDAQVMAFQLRDELELRNS